MAGAHRLLCAMLYVAGVGAALGIVWPALHGRTYFSENALLPGLVDNLFHDNYNQRMMNTLMRDFERRLVSRSEPDSSTCAETLAIGHAHCN
jgi:glycosylphosphatidylinositol transamidase